MSAADIDIKRYDRQIRLWGLDTQRGLVGARVLILGANGLANEVAKNLVLAGVGHVRIQDPDVVDAKHLSSGGLFSVSETQLGSGKAEALAEQLKAMNPSVDLVSSRSEVASLEVNLLQTYHFIIGTRGVEAVREVGLCTARLERRGASGENADPQSGADGQMAGVSDIAGEEAELPAPKRHRANGDSGPAVAKSNGTHEVCPMRNPEGTALPKFLAAGTLGLEGFCFFDLGATTTMITPPTKTGADDDAPKPVAQAEQALYPTVVTASRVEWAALTPRVPRLYYALQLLLADVTQPTGSGKATVTPAIATDVDTLLPSDASPETIRLLRSLLAHRTRLLATAAANTEVSRVVSNAYLASVAVAARTELAPVSAIVGGMVASEVIKVISGKERPINNSFFFDGLSSDGIVLRLGPSFDCPWGLDKGDYKPVRNT